MCCLIYVAHLPGLAPLSGLNLSAGSLLCFLSPQQTMASVAGPGGHSHRGAHVSWVGRRATLTLFSAAHWADHLFNCRSSQRGSQWCRHGDVSLRKPPVCVSEPPSASLPPLCSRSFVPVWNKYPLAFSTLLLLLLLPFFCPSLSSPHPLILFSCSQSGNLLPRSWWLSLNCYGFWRGLD